MNARVVGCAVAIVVAVAGCSAEPTVVEPAVTTTLASESGTADQSGEPVITEPILPLATTLVPGSGTGIEAQELFATRVTAGSLDLDTIDHVVTTDTADPIYLFHYERGGQFCHAAFGPGSAADGCSSNDQLAFDSPFVRRTLKRPDDSFNVWISNAPSVASYLAIETDTGAIFMSNVVRGTGYVVVDDTSTPVQARLLTEAGVVLWSGEVRT